MLSSVLDSLRAWPAVRRSALSTLIPSGEGQVARVFDLKAAPALRALGYRIVRGAAEPSAALAVVAAAKPSRGGTTTDDLDFLRTLAAELAPGGFLLLRAPLREREHIAAAFLHVGLSPVSQMASRRSVLTVGPRLAAPFARDEG